VTGKLEDLNTFDTLSFEAMNTSFYIAVSNYKFGNWKEAIQGWVHYVEQEWSRFQPNNELGKINQMEIGEKISLSPPLFDVLQKAEDYRGRTNGYFSPYLLPQMQYHGYEHTFPFQASKPVTDVMPDVYQKDSSPFMFDQHNGTVTRIAAGQIDLGGIGKGYTVQAVARWLKHNEEASSGIVDGGGDMTVWSDGEKEWKIAVAHPYKTDQEIAQFRIKNGSIATSNVIYRSWKQGNEKKHHILNGQTGLPVDSRIIQATVITEHCLDAEVGAKLCFMMEEQQLNGFLKKINPCFSFLLVNEEGIISNTLRGESMT
jgi:thiamine biosynthesis lipoprotein